jgi:hypothetical protein
MIADTRRRLNRAGRPLVLGLLRSPLHRLLSGRMTAITYTGRRSGRRITVPVEYERDGRILTVHSLPERQWWRNLSDGADVSVLLSGRDRHGVAYATRENGRVTVRIEMDEDGDRR